MAEQRGQADGRDDRHGQSGRLRQRNRQQTFEKVAGQGDGGGLFAAHAQHIGGARITGTLRARIGQAHEFTDNNRARQRAEQITQGD